jgi:DNA-binding transcriptional ArsR family regulator
MVVDQLSEPAADRVFQALGDATRRDIVRRCAGREASVSRLAEAYPMSFAAVQKHVAVLERAGLVVKKRRGREQLVHTEPQALQQARRALEQLEQEWRGRIGRMSDLLAHAPEPQQEKPTRGTKR